MPASTTSRPAGPVRAGSPQALTVAGTSARRAGPADDRHWRLGTHAALLLVLLLAVMVVVGYRYSLSADEGAARAQVELLARDQVWTTDHSFAEADPSGEAFPLEKSIRVDGGYAPYYKHPVFPLLLAPLVLAFGTIGPVLPSVLGAVLCALLAAVLSRRIRPGIERPTLWVVGAVSPMLFDSQLVIAHTLGAAAATGAVVAAIEARDRTGLGWLRWALLAAACTAAATLVRSEAMLFGLALAAVLGVTTLARRRLADAGLTAIIGAATLAGPVMDRMLAGLLVGGTDAATFAGGGGSDGDLLAARIHGLWVTWLQPSYGGRPGADLAALCVLALMATTALLIRSGSARPALIRACATAAAAAAIARLVLGPTDVTPGLLVAFPLLAVGLLLLDRQVLAPVAARIALGTATVFVLGVAATQYATGGSGEWGGRYFALAVPIIVPLVLAALAHAAEVLDVGTRRHLVVALGVVCLSLSLTAVLSLRAAHRHVEQLVVAVDRSSASLAPGDGGLPVVVTTDPALPRFAWDRLDSARWLLVPTDRVDTYTARLQRLGIDRFLLVVRDQGAARAAFTGAYRPGRSMAAAPGSRWSLTEFAPR